MGFFGNLGRAFAPAPTPTDAAPPPRDPRRRLFGDGHFGGIVDGVGKLLAYGPFAGMAQAGINRRIDAVDALRKRAAVGYPSADEAVVPSPSIDETVAAPPSVDEAGAASPSTGEAVVPLPSVGPLPAEGRPLFAGGRPLFTLPVLPSIAPVPGRAHSRTIDPLRRSRRPAR